jgi:CubicO group peptidase (beta-lactamase class C family)
LPAISSSVPSGTWTGILGLGSTRLRLRFDFGANGAVTGFTLDQGDQSFPGLAMFSDGGKLRIEFDSIQAVYTGRQGNADRIDGIWSQGADTPFTLLRGEQGLNQPIEPLSDAALSALLRQCGAPALGAAAARRGGASRMWVAGRRAIGNAPAVTAADQWHLGSITKSMTATLIARLVDAGEIRWDLRVGDALNGIAPDMQPNYRDVTLRHLLSHRSGLPADLSTLQLAAFQFADAAEIRGQRRRYARLALGLAPMGPAESTYLYSNNGYVVAAAMIEAQLGASWEDLIRNYVFQPLCLRSAGFGPPDAGQFGPLQQPVGHTADLDARLLRLFGARGIRPLRPGTGEVTDNPRVLGPAGRVHMNLGDLTSYLEAHRDRGDFLRPGSWQTLHTPPFGGDYALGWVVRADGTRWHNGSNGSWYAEAEFHTDNGIVSAAVCNEARQPAQNAVGTSLLRAAAAV